MIKGEFFSMIDETTGKMEFFLGKAEAAEKIGVSRQYIQQCERDGRPCRGFKVKGPVNRFFLVKTTDGRYRLCLRRSGAWVVAGSDKETIADDQMESWIDVSEVCYNGRKHNKV